MSGYRAGDEKVKKFKNCRTTVEFNSISLVRHGSSTTYETGLSFSVCRHEKIHSAALAADYLG